jgi:hypothetical protein
MSNVRNGYSTLADFKAYLRPPGQTLKVDAGDDTAIDRMIEVASRRVDALTARMFYPHIETYTYDLPGDDVIMFGDDLLEILSFKNGDGTSIANTEYILLPSNFYPKYSLRMRDISSVVFVTDSNASEQDVLDIEGYWGFHEHYTRAWKAVGTLAAAMADTTSLTFTMTAGHSMVASGGEIIKIGDELFNTVSVVTNTVTVQSRGDNGSTAAIHLINAPVYAWQQAQDVSELTLEIAKIMYNSRYGENVETVSTYTPQGIIVSPRSLPVWAQEILRKYQRLA